VRAGFAWVGCWEHSVLAVGDGGADLVLETMASLGVVLYWEDTNLRDILRVKERITCKPQAFGIQQ